MTMIFCSFASEDRACADEVRQGLEQAGYSVWREPDFPTPREQSYPYLIENAILGSAAVIVLWSHSAAAFAWTKRHILIAQRFFKPLIPVQLDETALPSTLLVESLAGTEPCREIVACLLPRLPAPGNADPLLALGEQASNQQFIRVRKEAIDQAAVMLQQGDHREEVLAILEYLARNDLMTGVREKAQTVLTAATQQAPSIPAPTRPHDLRHLFAVRCKHGHMTTFDRRVVCSAKSEIAARAVMRGLDELTLTCATCGVEMAVDVDCEGY